MTRVRGTWGCAQFTEVAASPPAACTRARRLQTSASLNRVAALHTRDRYTLFGKRALPDWATHLWVVEQDVAWTGSLISALQSIIKRPDSVRAPALQSAPGLDGAHEAAAGSGDTWATPQQPSAEPDYVAYDVTLAPPSWGHYNERNWQDNSTMKLWRSLLFTARYSQRLLDVVVGSMRAARVQFCESTGPSLCAAQPDWCVVYTGWDKNHPVLGKNRNTGAVLYDWHVRITPATWAELTAADKAVLARCQANASAGAAPVDECKTGGWLYHALKW